LPGGSSVPVPDGALQIDVLPIVSSHPDCAPIARADDIEFLPLSVWREVRKSRESHRRALVVNHTIDVVVLARHMQIPGNELCEFPRHCSISNLHTFPPGFRNARLYHEPYERDAKLFSATVHSVTTDFDEGPIIAQDVVHVGHSHSPCELIACNRTMFPGSRWVHSSMLVPEDICNTYRMLT
jgi:formyltetrahydrofolate deformylase